MYIGTHGRGYFKSTTLLTATKNVASNKLNASVAPNPTSDFIHMKFSSDGGGKLAISVFDPLGNRVIYLEPKEYGTGEFIEVLDLRGLRKGNYFVQLSSPKYKAAEHFMLI
jgi:hypothetical protein